MQPNTGKRSTPENVAGATIFFAYIAAALLFTRLIVNDLFALSFHGTSNVLQNGKGLLAGHRQRRKAQIHSALSAISFSMLSYHMLRFLILSYSAWASTRGIRLPNSLFGQHGLPSALLGKSDLPIWTWSKQSTLFQTFAEDILKPTNYWWTVQALTLSLGWNTYMVVQGSYYKILHPWTYFVLGQILPISFTQNLFYIALTLSDNKRPSPTLYPARTEAQILVPVLYFACLAVAPSCVGTTAFIPVLFFTRLLLFAPLALLRPTVTKTRLSLQLQTSNLFKAYRPFEWSFMAGSLLLLLRFGRTMSRMGISDVIQALHDTPAVSALGYDYMLGMFSVCIWSLLA